MATPFQVVFYSVMLTFKTPVGGVLTTKHARSNDVLVYFNTQYIRHCLYSPVEVTAVELQVRYNAR